MSDERKKLNIPGYQHPTEIVSVTHGKLYKTFNDKVKDYNKQVHTSVYSTFSDKQENTKSDATKSFSSCPVCTRQALYECECVLKDKQCEKGHVWYIENGSVYKGDPHIDE